MIGREVKLKSEYSTRISSQPLGTGVSGWSSNEQTANNLDQPQTPVPNGWPQTPVPNGWRERS